MRSTITRIQSKLTRRSLIASAATLPTAALSFHVPPVETPEPEMPDWWKRLTKAVESGDTEATARQLVIALHGVLAENAPDGLNLLGFQFGGDGAGGLDHESVWASARGQGKLRHWRPAFRDTWFKGFGGIPSSLRDEEGTA